MSQHICIRNLFPAFSCIFNVLHASSLCSRGITTAMPSSRDGVSSRKRAGREAHRSRKGWYVRLRSPRIATNVCSPQCRARKIKCDENRPECTRCVESGRACRIIDGLFRPHSFTFPAPASRAEGSPKTRSAGPQPPDQEESSEIWGSSAQPGRLYNPNRILNGQWQNPTDPFSR